jgi:hypothetical protein
MLYQFVQIVEDVAVVDSRVYCEKIIEVHHGDWMRDTLAKYQNDIEEMFGVFRLETGKPSKDSLGGRPERFALLTEPQCNALLALSRNTKTIVRRKLQLISEFETYKEIARKRLERQLSLTVSDVPGYTHTLDTLWKDSGIVNRWQVKQAVTRDFVEGKHYYIENGVMQITETCYLILMLNFRSKRGSDVSRLPSLVKIDKEELFQYEQRKRANARNPQKYCDPMQLNLFSE